MKKPQTTKAQNKSDGASTSQDKPETPASLRELGKKRAFVRFLEALGSEHDSLIVLLRAHLYAESLLEENIRVRLPRGDKILENGNLTFNQKLLLVDSFDCLPDSISSSLRNLNKLRNQCSHELEKRITNADIVKIGSPLGKVFTQFKKDAKYNDSIILINVITYVCGFLSGMFEEFEALPQELIALIKSNIIGKKDVNPKPG